MNKSAVNRVIARFIDSNILVDKKTNTVIHPFINNIVFTINNEKTNILENEEIEVSYKEGLKREIKGFDEGIKRINPKYKLGFVYYVHKLGGLDLGETNMFISNKMNELNFENDLMISKKKMLKILLEDEESIFYEDEANEGEYDALEDNLVVYRVMNKKNKIPKKGFVWYLNKKDALKEIYTKEDKLIEAKINKYDIFIYKNDNGILKVLLNYKRLKHIKKSKI